MIDPWTQHAALTQAMQDQNWPLIRTLTKDGNATDGSRVFPDLCEALDLRLALKDTVAQVVQALHALNVSTLPEDARIVLHGVLTRSVRQVANMDVRIPVAQERAAQVMRVLLEAGADPHGGMVDSPNGRSPAHAPILDALRHRNWPMIVALVHGGANVLATSSADASTVIGELCNAPPDAVLAVLEHGLTPAMLPHDMVEQVLLTSARWSDAQRVRIAQGLVRMGLDAITDGTVMIKLAIYDVPLCVQFLLDAGVDPKATTTLNVRTVLPRLTSATHFDALHYEGTGGTALHQAAWHQQERMVDVLLQAGVPLQAVTDDGASALHLAALVGSGSVVRRLVNAGLPFDLPDHQGRTPLQWARTDSEAMHALNRFEEQRALRQTVDSIVHDVPGLRRPRL